MLCAHAHVGVGVGVGMCACACMGWRVCNLVLSGADRYDTQVDDTQVDDVLVCLLAAVIMKGALRPVPALPVALRPRLPRRAAPAAPDHAVGRNDGKRERRAAMLGQQPPGCYRQAGRSVS